MADIRSFFGGGAAASGRNGNEPGSNGDPPAPGEAGAAAHAHQGAGLVARRRPSTHQFTDENAPESLDEKLPPGGEISSAVGGVAGSPMGTRAITEAVVDSDSEQQREPELPRTGATNPYNGPRTGIIPVCGDSQPPPWERRPGRGRGRGGGRRGGGGRRESGRSQGGRENDQRLGGAARVPGQAGGIESSIGRRQPNQIQGGRGQDRVSGGVARVSDGQRQGESGRGNSGNTSSHQGRLSSARTAPPGPRDGTRTASSNESRQTQRCIFADSDYSGVKGAGRQYWPPHCYQYFKHIQEEVDTSLQFEGRAQNARFGGCLPPKYCGIASPSDSPEVFFDYLKVMLNVNYFCLPDIVLWLPEGLPGVGTRLYPGCRPKCKWHNTSDCVNIRGWVPDPRHCYGDNRWVALMGKMYECSETKETFRSYDQTVIEKSPLEIRMIWKRIGFNLSHRGGLANFILARLRSGVNHGMSVSGFQRSILESMKTSWLISCAQWLGYRDSILKNPNGTCLFPTDEQKACIEGGISRVWR